MAFNVVNTRNDLVRSIRGFLDAVTEPALRPIRNILPNLGGVDISPVILILLIIFIQKLISDYLPAHRLLRRTRLPWRPHPAGPARCGSG